MNIEKLIERLWNYSVHNNALSNLRTIRDAADALSKLLAENEKLRNELEKVKTERDAVVEDFVDYVTDGVPNPAIFCQNRNDKCTDIRGWCTGKNCNGFYPSGASGIQKEGRP